MPSRKLSDEEIMKNKIKNKTKKFMDTARSFLASKNGGEVAPEWECSLLMLESYFSQFIRLTLEIEALDSIIEPTRYGYQPSPLLKARDTTAVRLESILKQMGMTLKSALTMDIAEPVQEESVLEKFVKGKIEKR